jgi:hypothetical protein
MRNWLKRTALALLVLGLAWVVIAWSGVLPMPSSEQRAALTLMRAPSQDAVGERNAFELFWLLPYAIPDAERERVLAEDIAALEAMHPTDGATLQLASSAFPRHVAKDAPKAPCNREPGCLQHVRADPDQARAVLVAHAPLLAQLRRLGDYDHLQTPYRPSFASPLPELGLSGPLQLTEAALAFVDGQPDAAIDGLCRDLAAWRKLKGRSDSLIFEMVSLAWLQGGAQLFADMRAELPRDHPLPTTCAAAFGPPLPAQRQSCDVYRAEFSLTDRVMADTHFIASDPGLGGFSLGGRLLPFNPEATAALMAPTYSRICAALHQPAAQWPSSNPADNKACGWVGMAFNQLGCRLFAIATPAYSDYGLRERDGEGMLHLLQLAEWLAQQEDPGSAFEQRPGQHRQFEQPVQFDAGELSIELLRPRGEVTRWRIALPGSRNAVLDPLGAM